jgi:hypothetical protein
MQEFQLSVHWRIYEQPQQLPEAEAVLLKEATAALIKSYSPYSNFRVAAAVRLANGEILSGANFENADVRGAVFSASILRRANLKGANFSGGLLDQADFAKADLSDALLDETILLRSTFDFVNIDGADFTDAIMDGGQRKWLCTKAKGTNSKTGIDTRESLECN